MLKLTLDNLCFQAGRKEILSGISCQFDGGKMVSVLGRNGAGKTTLIKAIAGLIPAKGKVSLDADGKILNKSEIAYLPQLESINSQLTAFETVLLGLSRNLNWNVSDEQLHQVETVIKNLNLTTLSQVPINNLSGGQKQLIFLAQAFVSSPKVLLLDEPTSALDIRHQLVVMQTVQRYCKENNAVVIFVIHDLMLASRFSDEVLFLHQGKIQSFDHPKRVICSELIDPIYRIESLIEENSLGLTTLTPIKPL